MTALGRQSSSVRTGHWTVFFSAGVLCLPAVHVLSLIKIILRYFKFRDENLLSRDCALRPRHPQFWVLQAANELVRQIFWLTCGVCDRGSYSEALI